MVWPQLSTAMCSGLAIAMGTGWGSGGETQRVLVVVSCLHFLLPWVIELAPGNPHPGKVLHRTWHFQTERFSSWILSTCILS